MEKSVHTFFILILSPCFERPLTKENHNSNRSHCWCVHLRMSECAAYLQQHLTHRLEICELRERWKKGAQKLFRISLFLLPTPHTLAII